MNHSTPYNTFSYIIYNIAVEFESSRVWSSQALKTAIWLGLQALAYGGALLGLKPEVEEVRKEACRLTMAASRKKGASLTSVGVPR